MFISNEPVGLIVDGGTLVTDIESVIAFARSEYAGMVKAGVIERRTTLHDFGIHIVRSTMPGKIIITPPEGGLLTMGYTLVPSGVSSAYNIYRIEKFLSKYGVDQFKYVSATPAPDVTGGANHRRRICAFYTYTQGSVSSGCETSSPVGTVSALTSKNKAKTYSLGATKYWGVTGISLDYQSNGNAATVKVVSDVYDRGRLTLADADGSYSAYGYAVLTSDLTGQNDPWGRPYAKPMALMFDVEKEGGVSTWEVELPYPYKNQGHHIVGEMLWFSPKKAFAVFGSMYVPSTTGVHYPASFHGCVTNDGGASWAAADMTAMNNMLHPYTPVTNISNPICGDTENSAFIRKTANDQIQTSLAHAKTVPINETDGLMFVSGPRVMSGNIEAGTAWVRNGISTFRTSDGGLTWTEIPGLESVVGTVEMFQMTAASAYIGQITSSRVSGPVVCTDSGAIYAKVVSVSAILGKYHLPSIIQKTLTNLNDINNMSRIYVSNDKGNTWQLCSGVSPVSQYVGNLHIVRRGGVEKVCVPVIDSTMVESWDTKQKVGSKKLSLYYMDVPKTGSPAASFKVGPVIAKSINSEISPNTHFRIDEISLSSNFDATWYPHFVRIFDLYAGTGMFSPAKCYKATATP